LQKVYAFPPLHDDNSAVLASN